MTIYTAILFIHAIAVLVLTACLTIETWMLIQLRRAASADGVHSWTAPAPRLAIAAVSSLVIIYVTGAYLTESLRAWEFAWPRFAVLEIVIFAVLGALTGARLRTIRRLSAGPNVNDAALTGRAQSVFLKLSLSIRIWIVVGTVLLTAVKPGLVESLIIVVASLVIGIASATVTFPQGAAATLATRP